MRNLPSIRFIDRGLAISLAVLFIASLITAAYLTSTLDSIDTFIRQGSDTAGSALVLQSLQVDLEAAESSQRGYIITGDAHYLKPYQSALKTIPAEQEMLSRPQYPISSSQLNRLNTMIAERLNSLQEGITLRKTEGANAAMSFIDSTEGLNATTNIRNYISSIVARQLQPFSGYTTTTHHNLHEAIDVAAILVFLIFILCLLIIRYFQRAIERERATENSKSEFLSMASHQLRTPATNVKQYIGLLLEGYLGELTPEQTDALKIANKNNEVGINIINDLLGVAKLDLQRIRLNKEPVNIYKLAREVVEAYRPQLKSRRQTLRFERPDKHAEALADSTYLKTVMENLLDNASKYSPARARITIRINERPSTVLFSIQDTGVGMNRTERDKLFKKFSRIPNPLSENAEGTGLGLYWVKQVVELHGGRINVKSARGKGSTFRVALPIY